VTERASPAQSPSVVAHRAFAAASAEEDGRVSSTTLLDFRKLFDSEFEYVWHALRRLGVREADLEDVTHDVFLAVYRRLDTFDASRPQRPWLFGFAYRYAADYRKLARHRREVLELSPETRDPSPSAFDRADLGETLRIANHALSTLELDRRAVFVLHELDECPMPEVAQSLGIPLNTAYSRLRLAREDLAAAIRRLRARGFR
jgi:RNA polymerase sigma-70 factor (ECF subfamily)